MQYFSFKSLKTFLFPNFEYGRKQLAVSEVLNIYITPFLEVF